MKFIYHYTRYFHGLAYPDKGDLYHSLSWSAGTYCDVRPLAVAMLCCARYLACASIADQAERLDWMSKLCLLWDLFEDILDSVSLLCSKSRYDDALPIQRRKTWMHVASQTSFIVRLSQSSCITYLLLYSTILRQLKDKNFRK